MKVQQYNILIYQSNTGKSPYSDWFKKLKDPLAIKSISRRILRMQQGNFGDCKQLNKNLYELRIPTGAGYRIYYTLKENEIVLLLIGGDKSTQTKDIDFAMKLLQEAENE